MARYIAAVDIGGTFSDLVCLDTKKGEMTNVKVPSTPPTFIEGVMDALKKTGIDPKQLIVFKHGSTIATNAIIQRRGARTGLVTTRGTCSPSRGTRTRPWCCAGTAWSSRRRWTMKGSRSSR